MSSAADDSRFGPVAADAMTPRSERITHSWTVVTIVLVLLSLVAAVAAEVIRELGVMGYIVTADWRSHSVVVLIAIAVAFVGVLVASPLTHVVGHRQHSKKGYAVFQPFVGGTRFITLQIIGWTFYALAITGFIALFYAIMTRIPVISGSVVSVVAGGAIAQLFLRLSLAYFDASQNHQPFVSSILFDISAFLLTTMFYSMPILVVMILAIPPIVLQWSTYFGIMIPSVIAYSFTYRQSPHRNGRRSWDLIRHSASVWSRLEHYFSYRLIAEGKLVPDGKYLYGYHPHGIYPCTTVWATRGCVWERMYPNVHVDVLGASVIFYLPFIRDVMMWCGGRDATRESINTAFAQKRSIMLVPGGEREMRENRPESDDIVLITRHKGFIRMALANGAALVPVFGFGESRLLDNFRLKNVQEWFSKRMFYGAPHLPYGRFYSPLPNCVPVTVVVGNPIPVKLDLDPSHETIDALHRTYFDALRDMFDRHKGSVAGFENARLLYPDFDDEH